MLTSTAEEIDRIVDVLAEAIDAVVGCDDPRRDRLGRPGRRAARLRSAPPAAGDRSARSTAPGPRFELDGRPVVSFASNDYLGLSPHPAVIAAAHDALDRWGTGAGASRSSSAPGPCTPTSKPSWRRGRAPRPRAAVPDRLRGQRRRARPPWPTRPRCSWCPTSSTTRRSSTAPAWPVAESRSPATPTSSTSSRCSPPMTGPALVVADSVFSMDGDEAPVDELAEVCARHGALLVLDEAHAVLGPALPAAAAGDAVVRVGTLSKTLGSLGGFVAGPSWRGRPARQHCPVRSSSPRRRHRPTPRRPWPRSRGPLGRRATS